MDGTLLNKQKQISIANLETLKEAADHGIRIVLASGRPLTGLKPYLKQLGLWQKQEFSITLSGATVQQNKTNKTFAQNAMEFKAYQRFYNFSQRHNCHIQIQNNHSLYTTDSTLSHWTTREGKMNLQQINQVKLAEIEALEDVYKMQLIAEPEDIERLFSKISPEVKSLYQVLRQERYAVDVLAPEAGKGNALTQLCELLNIPIEQTMAIGDGTNDLSMLKTAGLSVAMKNGKDVVKETADEITDSNDNDGVAKAIRKFVLK